MRTMYILPKERIHGAGILSQLLYKGIDRLKATLFPHLLVQKDFKRLTVDIIIEMEDICLNSK